jgi:hypothetical protein
LNSFPCDHNVTMKARCVLTIKFATVQSRDILGLCVSAKLRRPHKFPILKVQRRSQRQLKVSSIQPQSWVAFEQKPSRSPPRSLLSMFSCIEFLSNNALGWRNGKNGRADIHNRRYYPKLTLDFETNKRICDEIAIIASKRLRNKVWPNICHSRFKYAGIDTSINRLPATPHI